LGVASTRNGLLPDWARRRRTPFNSQEPVTHLKGFWRPARLRFGWGRPKAWHAGLVRS